MTDLEGSQTGYTWVVVATLLTMTATTPIWGKLADLFSKKMLVQIALVIFSVGSLVAGFAPSMEVLIGARAVQGLGVGGLTALVQVVIASMVSRVSAAATAATSARRSPSPRSAARSSAACWSTPSAGAGASSSACRSRSLAFVVLQKTLRLPVDQARDVHIDYLGATLIMGGVSMLLVWVSLGGNSSTGPPRQSA